MVEVYYYVPQDKVRDSIECGLKLSQWYEKEVQIEFENKKCLCALLNPRDDMDKYKSPDYKCLRLELYPEYCYVADKSLYELGLQHDEVMKLYMDSIIPIKDYIFGMYRLPECLLQLRLFRNKSVCWIRDWARRFCLITRKNCT